MAGIGLLKLHIDTHMRVQSHTYENIQTHGNINYRLMQRT